MPLDPVVEGAPHVQAHNDERALINEIELRTTDAALDARVEEALEDFTPGVQAAIAKLETSVTFTDAAYPGSPIPGLAINVLGNGRPVELKLVCPSITHTVAGAAVNLQILADYSLSPLNTLSTVVLPVAGKGNGFIMEREVVIPDGVTKTFYIYGYSDTAGTSTLVAANYCPVEFKAIRR